MDGVTDCNPQTSCIARGIKAKSYFLLSPGLSICQAWVMPKPWVAEVSEELSRHNIYAIVFLKKERHSQGKRCLFLFAYAKFIDADDTIFSVCLLKFECKQNFKISFFDKIFFSVLK